MSRVTVNSTAPPVTVVFSRGVLITMTVMLAPTCMGQTTLVLHNVDLLPQLIDSRDTVKDSDGLTTMLWQQQPQSQMPFQEYANYAMGLHR